MSWKQHMSTQDTKGQEVKDSILFVIRKNIFFIYSFLNFSFFLSVMEAELKKKYCNITRQVIHLYLALCEHCQLKKKIPKRGLVVRPIFSHYMNSWCQVDLIDMQSEPDGYYRFIVSYQDHLTKFTILRPPEEQNRRGSGLSANGHLLYVWCSILTAERQWPQICEQNNTKLG